MVVFFHLVTNKYILYKRTVIKTNLTRKLRSSLSLGPQQHVQLICFCFTKRRSSLFTGFNKYQKKFITYQTDWSIMPFIEHVATQGTYKLEVYIPNDTGTATAKSTIAQWCGWPRRLVYKDSLGSARDLTNPISSINNLSTLNTAKAAYDAVITAGGKFNQGGYPPLNASIEFNKFVVVARYDNRRYNEKSVRCNLNKATYELVLRKNVGTQQAKKSM